MDDGSKEYTFDFNAIFVDMNQDEEEEVQEGDATLPDAAETAE